MSKEELAKFCPNGKITDIQCIDAQTGDDSTSLAEASCTVEGGLSCTSLPFPGIPPCHDYKIRYMCSCSDAVTATPVPPVSVTPNQKIQVNCDWSPWLNADSPDVGNGDMETLTEIRRTFGVCPTIADIECRVAGSPTLFSQAGQDRLMCDVLNGFRCFNNEQKDGQCLDYEVRVLCWGQQCTGPTPTPPLDPTMGPQTTLPTDEAKRTTGSCPPGEEWQSCAFNCEEVCDFMGRSSGACQGILTQEDNCIPGCRPPPELPRTQCGLNERLIEPGVCVPKEMCTCLKPDGTVAKPFEMWDNPERECSSCSCFNGEVICGSMDGCSTTPPPPGQTVAPLPPVCGWSEWMNENKPSLGSGGDMELLSALRPRYNLCDRPVRIMCRDVALKKEAADSGQVVTCDVNEGLKCFDYNNPGRCDDYEISVYCACTPTPAPNESGLGSPTPKPSPSCTSGWSAWINRNSPIGSNGDQEKMTPEELSKFCPGGAITDIQCVDSDTLDDSTSLAEATCSVEDGLSCTNIDFIPPCRDYKIRYMCNCSGAQPTPSPQGTVLSTSKLLSSSSTRGPSTPAPQPVSVITTTPGPAQACTPGWSSWINQNSPVGTDGDYEKMTKAELSAFCPNGQVTDIECVDSDTGDDATSLAEAECNLEDGLSCTNIPFDGIPPCRDYQIRYKCNCSGVTSSPSSVGTYNNPSSTPLSNSPVCGWTMWMNGHTPSPVGEEESFTSLRQKYAFCQTSDITAIECRDAATGKSAQEMGQVNVVCDNNYSGLKCLNADQPNGQCLDYEVRFLCEPKGASCKPNAFTNGPLPGSTTTDSPVLAGSPTCTSGWSNWVNENSPIGSDGDKEKMTADELRNFCPGGSITDINCVDSDTLDDSASLAEASCTVEDGLSCKNDPIIGIPCRDYKIRYMCNCSSSTSHSVGKRSVHHLADALPSSNIPVECLSNMGLRSGLVRNNMITASSFRDTYHSPQMARLDSQGSWLAAIDDLNQYIQVDFLTPVYLTGLTTQGRPDAPSFVKSYRILHSLDGINWNPYQEQRGIDMIFEGNTDIFTPVKVLFKHPVLTRLLRIQPVSWHGRIAMRFEVHGCSTEYPLTAPLQLDSQMSQMSEPTEDLDKCIVWDDWQDLSQPGLTSKNDIEPIEDLVRMSPSCKDPVQIECRTATPDLKPAQNSGQNVVCNLWDGLRCTADKANTSMCYNYEARLGCWKSTAECLSKRSTEPKKVSSALREARMCFSGMDSTHCPHMGCANGLYCNGVKCVPRNECPCMVDDTVIRPGAVVRNKDCETCQCIGGEVLCMPKVCPACQVGESQLNKETCSCQCNTCSSGEFQCATGLCIPAEKRCDGVIDCADDEHNCAHTAIFVRKVQPEKRKGQTMCHYTMGNGPVNFKVGDSWQDGLCKLCTCKLTAKGTAESVCDAPACPKCQHGEVQVPVSGQCCGQCVAAGCKANGNVYKVGEVIPGARKCFTKTCQHDSVEGHYFVQESQIECPKLDTLKTCTDVADMLDSDGCCLKCIPQSITPAEIPCESCKPQLMFEDPEKSVGFIKLSKPNGVQCENTKPIRDLQECSGFCESKDRYTETGFQLSRRCCQAQNKSTQVVKLHCSDGTFLSHELDIPQTCSCSAC
ncbi:hemocytin isoform X2 [Aplysia californica]|uniref:Hemocytin isoform X2 n=1 Tax=Aplysia californica TaxID=6500 RepID=A0ABM1VX56_APLCA|nr:hemocytin isoform X2 [Aplysia californica]